MRRLFTLVLLTAVLLVPATAAHAGPGLTFESCVGLDTGAEEGAGRLKLCLLSTELRLPDLG